MKKNLILKASMFMAVLAISMTSCSSDDNPIIVDTDPPVVDPNLPVELLGELTTRTLTKDKKYLLKGTVFVRTGVILTIEPGTVIFGDKATKGTLVIDRGGKIIAEGGSAEEIIYCDIDLAYIDKVRARLNALADVRKELI